MSSKHRLFSITLHHKKNVCPAAVRSNNAYCPVRQFYPVSELFESAAIAPKCRDADWWDFRRKSFFLSVIYCASACPTYANRRCIDVICRTSRTRVDRLRVHYWLPRLGTSRRFSASESHEIVIPTDGTVAQTPFTYARSSLRSVSANRRRTGTRHTHQRNITPRCNAVPRAPLTPFATVTTIVIGTYDMCFWYFSK